MRYVVSDLHGEYDKFILLLNKINFTDNDTLYILGDVIDRGKDSIKLLQYIMQYKNMKILFGNHEGMMLKSLCGNRGYYNCWMNNGGYSTLTQFDKLIPEVQGNIIEYLSSLPLIYNVDDKFILVHAGIEDPYISSYFDAEEFFSDQSEEVLLWERPQNINKPMFKNYKLIFGHTPTCYLYEQKVNPMKIWYNNTRDRIGIDCGCCFNGGRLGCLCLDDMKEYYI